MLKFIKAHLFILIAGICSQSCTAPEDSDSVVEPVDLVYPFLDTENSRWFFFSSACRPFGMVNLSPDTQTDGEWGSGYRYQTDTIKGFTHIHEWQLSGLSVMPVSDDEQFDSSVLKNYYSRFDHRKEKVFPGYHKVELDRYQVTAELTSTRRVGFHRYTFPKGKSGVILNLGGTLGPSEITGGQLYLIDSLSLAGELTNAPTFRRPKPAKVFFHIMLNTPVTKLEGPYQNGKYLVHLRQTDQPVLMKAAISYTSVENARINLKTELSHWDFDGIVKESREEWNEYLGRIQVKGGTEAQQRRFYTDLWHALQGRRTISDVNGYYPDNTGDHFQVKQLPLDETGKPKFNHYNSDSFWGAQWTINTLWHLVYPEITDGFVNSLLQYYQDGGLVPRGPSGGNYTFVMTGASSTTFIVSAFQKGIRNYDVNLAFEALKKNHMPGGIMAKAGYEHNTSLGGGLDYYIQQGYVPYPIPEGQFGSHQDGASLTLEYAYQDWSLAQMAKALGKDSDYQYFLSRSENYRNVFDTTAGWIRPKDAGGQWMEPFDPYTYEHGFNESNGAQSTWFVPHNLMELAELMGGKDSAVAKLNRQFEQAQKLGFTSGTAHDKERHPEYSRIPVNYGNQPSIQTAFIFTHLGRPDLTQYWSRQVVDAVYEGLQTNRGYNGDEDQGLMGALSVLMKIGLFQMTGGTEADPVYEITSPVFNEIRIRLDPKYYPGEELIIQASENSPRHAYVRGVTFNGQVVSAYSIRHGDLVKGGIVKLEMSNKP